MKETMWLSHIAAENEEGHSLKDYSLRVFTGEIVCVFGEYGAGKRIIQSVLMGELPLTTGSLFINEEKVLCYTSSEAQKRGVFQIDARKRLIQGLSIEENIFAFKNKKNYFAIFNKKAARQQLVHYLERIDMDFVKKKLVDELSAFEEQMICIAKALANNVQLIVLNCSEHYYNEYEMKKLTGIIKKLSSDGVSFLILSEKVNEFMLVADRIQYIQDGADVFIYDYKGLLKHQSLLGYKTFESRKDLLKEKSITEYKDSVKHSPIDYEMYWKKNETQNADRLKYISEMEIGVNTYVVSENSALCLIPTLDVANNLCVRKYTQISKFGIINKSILKYIEKEFYEITGISPGKRRIYELSYFEKKLVSIYRFVLLHPKFLVFENPFFGLSSRDCEGLKNFFIYLINRGIKVVILSNSSEEIKSIYEDVNIIEKDVITSTKKDTFS